MVRSFGKTLQARPKLRAVKKKINKQKAVAKRLSSEFKRLVKSEGRIVGRQMNKAAKKRAAAKRKKRR